MKWMRIGRGRLHRPQEEAPHPQEDPEDSDQEEVHREGLPQVHRHQLQVRPRSLPDARRQGQLHGAPQEGPQARIGSQSYYTSILRPKFKLVLCFVALGPLADGSSLLLSTSFIMTLKPMSGILISSS